MRLPLLALIALLVPAANARLLETEQDLERRHGRTAYRFEEQQADGVVRLREALYRPADLHVNAFYGTAGEVARAWTPGRPIIADVTGRVIKLVVTRFEGNLDAKLVADFFGGYETTWGFEGREGWQEVDIPSYFTCLVDPQPGCAIHTELLSRDGRFRATLSRSRAEIAFRQVMPRR